MFKFCNFDWSSVVDFQIKDTADEKRWSMKCLLKICRSKRFAGFCHRATSYVTLKTTAFSKAHSTFEIDDNVFGLTDDEKQFRRMVFQFAQKELNAQKTSEIDKTNSFPEFRQFVKKMWGFCSFCFLFQIKIKLMWDL